MPKSVILPEPLPSVPEVQSLASIIIALSSNVLKLRDYLVTYPPDPLPLIKGRGSVGKRGAKPLSKISSPSPLKERGIKGVR